MTKRREQPAFLDVTHDVVAASDALNHADQRQAEARYRRANGLTEPAPVVTPAKRPSVKVLRSKTPPAPVLAPSQATMVGRGGRTPVDAPEPFTALYVRPSSPSKVVAADSVVLSREVWGKVDKLINATAEPRRFNRQPRMPRRT